MARRSGARRRPEQSGAALLLALFWGTGLALLCVPFLLPRYAADPEGGDWGRQVSEVDLPFAEDVAIFEEEFDLPLGELIASESEQRFALGSPGLAALGIVDEASVVAGDEQYQRHCVGCHGRDGDGAGPGARYLDPRPRNFRSGMFKFTSTETGRKPRRADLYRTITRGLGGSSMPEFRLLSEELRWDLVEYVLWISIRGEFEQSMLDWAWADEELPDPDEVAESVLERWSEAETRAVYPPISQPPDSVESIARGREVYLDTSSANCISCHGPTGRGDGVAAGDFDDDWGYPIVPRDLTTGQFRAGDEPADLYRSIATGVNGTPMTSFGGALTPEEIWDLVHYVQSLSHAPESTGGER